MQTVLTLVPTVMVKNLILLLVFHIAALPFSSADSVQVQMFPPIRFLHFVIFDGSNVFVQRKSLYESLMILIIDFRQ